MLRQIDIRNLHRGAVLFVVFLALATYGANAPLSFNVTAIAACLVLLTGLALHGLPEKARGLIGSSAILFALLTLWIFLQTVPMPEGIAASIWRELPNFGIEGGRNSISLAPADTAEAWLRLSLPFMLFLSVLVSFRTDEEAESGFFLLAVGGGLLSALGLIQFLLLPQTLLLGEKEYYADSFTFVFINRNTAATALGLLALALFVRVWLEWEALDRSRLYAWVLNGVPLGRSMKMRPFLTAALLLLVVLVSLGLTKSRGGTGATAIAAMVMAGLLAFYGSSGSAKGFQRRKRGLLTIAIQMIAAVVVIFTLVSLVAPRAVLRGEVQGAEDARFCIADGLMAAARDNIYSGGGFGTFRYVFSPYRDPACGIIHSWDKAHNFYLDGLIGLGVVFVPVLAAAAWILLRSYRAGLRERRKLRIYSMAGIAGLVLVAVHGFVDFSLQIPGLAVLFAAFAGFTLTISLGRSRRGETGRSERLTLPSRRRLLNPLSASLAVLAMVSAVMASFSLRDTVAAAAVASYARQLSATDKPDPETLADVASKGLPGERLTTCNFTAVRASLAVSLAYLDTIDRDAEYAVWERTLGQAEAQIAHALQCTPADGDLWLRLAMVRQAAGELPGEQAQMMALSQQFSPAEEGALLGRLVHWNALSPETLQRSQDVLAADVRNALVYAPMSMLTRTLTQPSPGVLSVVQETLPLLPANRRERLAKQGFSWAQSASEKGKRV